MSLIVMEEEAQVTSESLAGSLNTKSAIIRKSISMLRKADLVRTSHA
ncbi:helix-turn-helix domain-containing protein [Marinilactibacillus psychrotolerans]|uniref:Rrf2 family transcriptional regulator n=2 Tax=Marinilactibacillus psychrotolerans TaxID=191770 RepID=A0ABW8UMQ0_9LACT|nr:Rrf2 family transcriptional regulator [Marinilactibacillus psychrotolerans]SJN45003.1 hypothetical protein FM115_10890 [Marinilactibacillus psychrotolerans 42ea]